MADLAINTILSICATTSNRVKDLVIKDGQLIFIQDVHRIAFDFKGKRIFYNQIDELSTEFDRQNLSSPINGKYYFVIETAVLWRYFDGWTQLTTPPDEIVFIGTELPELGKKNTLYAQTEDGNENISIWDEKTESFKIIADKTHTANYEDIIALFNN